MAQSTEGKNGKPPKISPRDRRLMALEHWDEIEVRLRCRHSPQRVVTWHQKAYPDAEAPSIRTLFRYLADKKETWFVSSLLLEETVTARMPHLLPVEEHAELLLTQKLRLKKGLAFEDGMGGLLIPELSRNVDMYSRMIEQHERLIHPKTGPAAKEDEGGDPRDGGRGRELVPLVERMAELPTEDWLAAMQFLVGPPPVKQPLNLGEATVIEKRPLTPEERGDDDGA